MNAGVRLVHAYLTLNGYFTISELPIIRELRRGGYVGVTDLDLLAVRFPGAGYVVTRGRPGPDDDLRLEGDERLLDLPDHVDVIIAEVKEGKARLNDALRTTEALYAALRRVGCVPDARMDGVVAELRTRGEARLDAGQPGIPTRIRLLAFGDGKAGPREGYAVFPLKAVARFVEGHLDRYHAVLTPADLGDTALGLMHLLRKLR